LPTKPSGPAREDVPAAPRPPTRRWASDVTPTRWPGPASETSERPRPPLGGGGGPRLGVLPSGPTPLPQPGIRAQAPPDRTAQTWTAAGRGHGTTGYRADTLSTHRTRGPRDGASIPEGTDRHPDYPGYGRPGGGAPPRKMSEWPPPTPPRELSPQFRDTGNTPQGDPAPFPKDDNRGGDGPRLGISPSGPAAPHKHAGEGSPTSEYVRVASPSPLQKSAASVPGQPRSPLGATRHPSPRTTDTRGAPGPASE